MRVTFSDTIVFDKFLISPKLYMFIIHYPTSSVDISKLIKYYTDNHDVDENVRSVTEQSGYWGYGTDVGIAFRYMCNDPLSADNTVASKNK